MNKRRAFCTVIGGIGFLIAGTLVLFAVHYIESHMTPVEIAKVHCKVTIEPSIEALRAQNECIREKREFETGGLNQVSGMPYPRNASLADFDWDDGCLNYCIYKRLGLLAENLIVPAIKKSHELLSMGSLSTKRRIGIVRIWNDCVNLAVTTTFKRGFDICRTMSYHSFCVSTKWQEKELDPGMYC